MAKAQTETQRDGTRSTGVASSRKTLAEKLAERRVAGLGIDLTSMALLSNIHRASTALRLHFERSVLREADLHWSAFVALWCLWIYGDMETRHLAEEASVAKSTLSGILNMLEARGLVARRANEAERRLVIVALTKAGSRLITGLFARFNEEETRIVAALSKQQIVRSIETLRAILATVAALDAAER